MNRLSRLASATALILLVAVSPLAAGPARADVPNCDIDCGGGGGGPIDPGGGGVPVAPAVPACTVNPQGEHATFHTVGAPGGVNDVAAGLDGSVWVTTSVGTFQVNGSRSVPVVGKRLAVDPSGFPWIVDFDGRIWRAVNAGGSVVQMPGLARDIGIGGNGDVWVIGTNTHQDSYQVWHLVNGGWVADDGAGESIGVTAGGLPVITGPDGKLWIRDGGPNSGWSLFGDQRAADVGLAPCARNFAGDLGGTDMWIVGASHDAIGENPRTVWSWSGAFGWAQSTALPAQRVAVDTLGQPWVVAQNPATGAGVLEQGTVTSFPS